MPNLPAQMSQKARSIVYKIPVIPLWAQIAGGAAAVASIVSSSTQTTRLVRVRTAAGIAPSTWLLLATSSLAWFAYGVSVRSPQQIIANGTWVILVIPLSWFMLIEKPLRTRLGAQFLIALSLLFLLGLGVLNENIPAYIGMPASILVNLPQIRYTIQHGRGPGISVAAWAFLATSSYLWFTYGIGAGEVPVIINSGIAALLGTVAVTALLVRPTTRQSMRKTTSDADLVTGRVKNVEVPLSPNRI
jgi:uncharacterized protein with PQ loop repeat